MGPAAPPTPCDKTLINLSVHCEIVKFMQKKKKKKRSCFCGPQHRTEHV